MWEYWERVQEFIQEDDYVAKAVVDMVEIIYLCNTDIGEIIYLCSCSHGNMSLFIYAITDMVGFNCLSHHRHGRV